MQHEGFQCSYFDPASQDWSVAGVMLVSFDVNGGPLCASTHLTDFAGLVIPTAEHVVSPLDSPVILEAGRCVEYAQRAFAFMIV